MTPEIKYLKDKTKLTSLAADIVSVRLLEDINNSGQASFMVSGGSTPGPLYERLSRVELPWHKVKIGLVDERWVGEEDAGSNAALIGKTLLQNHGENAQFSPMVTEHKTATAGQDRVEKIYRNIARPYSVIVLGMGGDGHTASWFPDADGLTQALDMDNNNLVQAVTAKPSPTTGAYLERMTLTRSALANCTLALLLITGADKHKILAGALQDKRSPLPIRAALDVLGERLIVLSAP